MVSKHVELGRILNNYLVMLIDEFVHVSGYREYF